MINDKVVIDCQLIRNLLESLPGLYHPSELKSQEVFDWDSHAPLKVNKEITKKFKENSDKAKNNVVGALLRPNKIKVNFYKGIDEKDLQILHNNLQKFYANIQIYTKGTYYDKLKEGFDWTIQLLKSNSSGSNKKWAMFVERLIDSGKVLQDPHGTGAKASRDHIIYKYKSTEWIGNLFLNYCLSKRGVEPSNVSNNLSCLIDAVDVDPKIVQDNDTYILFDDGAYSGQQKADILKTFIHKIHRKKSNSVLIITIPYYTQYALDRFQGVITTYINTLEMKMNATGETNVTKEIVVTHEKNHCRYEVKTIIKKKVYQMSKPILGMSIRKLVESTVSQYVSHIYIWTAGTVMEDTMTLLQKNVLANVIDKKENGYSFCRE